MAKPQLHYGPAARGTAIAAAALFALSACGGGGGGDDAGGGGGGALSAPEIPDAPKVQADSKIADMVPAEYRDKGTVKVGSDTSYAPAEFLDEDGKTPVGFDIQLFDAAAARMDLKVQWESAAFGGIVEGVDSGKYDFGVSSFTINAERLAKVNMVSYFNVGTQWFTAKGNPAEIDPDNACGKKIAVQADTVQVEDMEARNKKCADDGKAEIDVQQFEGQDQATAAIASGKADAGLADMPVAAYAVEQTGGKLATLGEQYEAAPYGVLVDKEGTEMADAIAAAYQSLIDDGTYDEILKNWKLEQGTLEKTEVNPDVEG
ncbi:amino acid ABC transporter substrate-binding protein (PAAT family) [Murinocardiopsis flavida]|uniref:Amino acid ABC transporter substrate-binding protein (PAAT family) n=1 Tax=Murinocardiopsis flavida TaxID=645275 RepID=A0A2P8DJN5_9ACTN|nr:ABC transporter substrate-binding protein [Murinocardiopsis flavida]PSK97437.1 amino acid ABC transporter substrate-binding protein (PAAT family) [Murinocardiopsis flavida]